MQADCLRDDGTSKQRKMSSMWLRILDTKQSCIPKFSGSRIVSFQATGMSFLATLAVGLATFTTVSDFTVGTGYGAIAVREYFGPGLFDLLLTDEPTNWRAGHYIFLFLTPLRLVYPFMNLGTFTPFFFLWPTIPPYSVREQLAAESRRLDGRSTLIFTPEDHDNTTCDWMVAKHILVHTVEAWS
ncbi:hypothetical protein HHX47_DHR3000069 [Lentinula edodes]|nr:hypothetical protein HHX47_DHR3000069 [Lentinula edodes]